MNIRFPSFWVLVACAMLSGCMVAAEDGWTTPIATTTGVEMVGSNAVFYYSLDDGYYYDRHYRRLPYRPDRYARVHRIHNVDDYRRHHQSVRQGQNNRSDWDTQNRQTNSVRGKNTQEKKSSAVQHPTLINRQTGQRIQPRSYPIRRSGNVGFRSNSSSHSMRTNPNENRR